MSGFGGTTETGPYCVTITDPHFSVRVNLLVEDCYFPVAPTGSHIVSEPERVTIRNVTIFPGI